MNSAKKFLTIAGAFALATLVFTLSNPKTVHAFAATLVQVVNTSQNPVPVAGALGIDPNNNSVQVANTPTVNVGSLPSVQVSSLPSVQVSNQLADHALQAVVLTGTLQFHDGDVSNSAEFFSSDSAFLIPSGKRLVIQSASVTAQVPTGEKLVTLAIQTETKAASGDILTINHDLVPAFTGTFLGFDQYRLSQELTTYSDQGIVQLIALRDNSTGVAPVQVIVSGYLVDCSGPCPLQP